METGDEERQPLVLFILLICHCSDTYIAFMWLLITTLLPPCFISNSIVIKAKKHFLFMLYFKVSRLKRLSHILTKMKRSLHLFCAFIQLLHSLFLNVSFM